MDPDHRSDVEQHEAAAPPGTSGTSGSSIKSKLVLCDSVIRADQHDRFSLEPETLKKVKKKKR